MPSKSKNAALRTGGTRRKSKSPSDSFNLSSLRAPKMVTAPTSVGLVLPRSSFSFAGNAQKMADYDSGSSLRVTGCDLFSDAIVTTSSSSQVTYGFNGYTWVSLTPTVVSSRLQAVEEMFQWYAFRKIRVIYIPTCGTNQGVSVALGISTDADQSTVIPHPTQQQVMEYNPTMLVPVWQIASMEFKHSGVKLFQTYASSEGADTRVQALIAATLLGASTSTTYGQLWLEYTIDFYQQSPINTSTSRLRCAGCSRRVAPTCDSLPSGKEEKKPTVATCSEEPSSPTSRTGARVSHEWVALSSEPSRTPTFARRMTAK